MKKAPEGAVCYTPLTGLGTAESMKGGILLIMAKDFYCGPPDIKTPDFHPDLPDLCDEEDDDDKVFYPGQYDYAVSQSIAALNEELSIMKQEFENDSKIQTQRFIIQTVVSVIALCASVVAAVAAVIPLLRYV